MQPPSPREQAVASAATESVVEGAARLDRLVAGLQRPWSLAFTPEGEILVTEKYRGLRLVRGGEFPRRALAGGPTGVFAEADSGLLDVASDPDFARNPRCSSPSPKATRRPIARPSGARVTRAAAWSTGA